MKKGGAMCKFAALKGFLQSVMSE